MNHQFVCYLTVAGALCFAPYSQASFSDDQAYADSLRHTPTQAMTNYPADTNVPGYSDHPSEESYYSGVTQQTSTIDNEAAASVNQTGSQASDQGAGNSVTNDFVTRPHYDINTTSPMIQTGQQMEQDAYNITHGISDETVNCQAAASQCQSTYTTQTCQAPVNLGNPVCTENLVPQVTPGESVEKTITVTVGGQASWLQFPRSTITVNLANGQASSSNSRMHVNVSGSLGINSCETLGINQKTIAENGTQTTWQQLPSCDNHLVLKVAVTDQYWYQPYQPYQSKVTLALHAEQPATVTTAWTTNCSTIAPLVDAGVCQQTSSTCTEGQATKTIAGVPITADCWQKTDHYHCQSSDITSTCAALEHQGCQVLSSVCSQEANGVCTAYQDTYQCADNVCPPPSSICGDSNAFCLNGDCAPNTPSQTSSQDFGKSATDLAGVNGAGQDVVDQQPPNESDIYIFTGQSMHCREAAMGFSNCCTDHGWGQNIHLAKCNSEEKQLGIARQKGLAIHVGGSYCSHSIHTIVGNVCTEKSEGFCVFDSDIPLDTQRDGRAQLTISWGSSHYPDCRGLTSDEIDQIDFDQVDFSNYEQSVIDGTAVPASDALQAQIAEQTQADIDAATGAT